MSSPEPLKKDRPAGIRRRGGKVRDQRITLSHGSGGKAMRDLIDDVFIDSFDNATLAPLEDQARFSLAELLAHGDRLAFTTDSYVVDPLFVSIYSEAAAGCGDHCHRSCIGTWHTSAQLASIYTVNR